MFNYPLFGCGNQHGSAMHKLQFDCCVCSPPAACVPTYQLLLSHPMIMSQLLGTSVSFSWSMQEARSNAQSYSRTDYHSGVHFLWLPQGALQVRTPMLARLPNKSIMYGEGPSARQTKAHPNIEAFAESEKPRFLPIVPRMLPSSSPSTAPPFPDAAGRVISGRTTWAIGKGPNRLRASLLHV